LVKDIGKRKEERREKRRNIVELKHTLTLRECVNVSYKKGQKLQCWVIVNIKYVEIGESGQSTYIDAKGIENALQLTARI